VIPRTVHALFEQLGSELDDLSLAYGADGRDLQSRAVRALNQAGKKEWASLRGEGIDPLAWKQVVSLTVDANDDERYPLPPRARQTIMVKDDDTQYHPLTTYQTAATGYVLEEGARAVRLRNVRVKGTVNAWIIQEPVQISASTVDASAGASTITLVASPSVGSTVVEDDYYNGALIGIASGTGVGEIKRITDYDGGTRVATVDSAWTNPPVVAGNSVYSILTDLPQVAVTAQVLRAALQIIRSDEVMKEFYADIKEDYVAAHRDAVVLINNANMAKVDVPTAGWTMLSDDSREYS